MSKRIKEAWKKLHKEVMVTLGDFPTQESRAELLAQCPHFDEGAIAGLKGGLLTFQKNGQVLGLVHYREGHSGTLFIEPIPFEPQGAELVNDGAYVQYGLLKAHEISHIRKVIVVRQEAPLHLANPHEASFFQEHGFNTKKLNESEWSRSAFIK